VVKVILHKTALPPQTDGSIVFARWRQCARIRGHIGATWRIRLNLCFLRPTRVHNSNRKSIGSTIFAQLTADTLQWVPRTPNCPFPWCIWSLDVHLTPFLWPIRAHNPNGISIGSTVFAGLTSVTDRPTDHSTRSITIDRIYLHSTGDAV